MTILRFIRIILENRRLLFLLPVTMAVLVFFLTKNSKKTYSTSTLIYTGLASGYTLESGDNARMDYFSVNNAFDNLINTIKAKSTLQEVGVKLLAQHLHLTQADSSVATEATLERLHEELAPAQRKKLRGGSLLQTEQNIVLAMEKREPELVKFFNKKEIPYSVEGIARNLKVERQASSDMVQITYAADDPAVAQKSVVLLCEIFMRRYKDIKVGETGSVVAYFEDQMRRSLERLSGVEENLKDFSTQNRIINFYEQSKIIASQERDINLAIENEKSNVVGLEAVLADLEEKLSVRREITVQSGDINRMRDSLSVLNSRLAMLQLTPDKADVKELSSLKKNIIRLEERMKSGVASLYGMTYSKQGIPTTDLFNRWMDALVAYDKAKAKVQVLGKIKQDYVTNYDVFAPLGSGLNRLERQVGVAEREYLEILHSLNLSKLREQNLQLSTNLKMVDKPLFPTQPEPSKRLVLVLASFIAGFILALSYIIGRELLDFSIKTPVQAARLVGLPYAGALPLRSRKGKNIAFEVVEQKLLNQAVDKIKLETEKKDPTATKLIVLFSLHSGEGKTYFAQKLSEYLNRLGDNTLLVQPVGEGAGEFALTYTPPANFSALQELVQLHPKLTHLDTYRYVLIEIPSVIDHVLPMHLLRQADMSMLVLAANRTWGNASDFSIKRYLDVVQHPVFFLLNKVRTDVLEQVIGEIPKRRSKVRQLVKKQIA